MRAGGSVALHLLNHAGTPCRHALQWPLIAARVLDRCLRWPHARAMPALSLHQVEVIRAVVKSGSGRNVSPGISRPVRHAVASLGVRVFPRVYCDRQRAAVAFGPGEG